ncbi:Secretory lipase [Persephonella hydrogeniphila]|uniref:Secretory lipase n=2 Tax=Persephonella hydrogeniphila TaxID=198703 RepID=A0A285NKA9_9AQUI|nr:Secretory lipase [Persephonella hydrogeniphila]
MRKVIFSVFLVLSGFIFFSCENDTPQEESTLIDVQLLGHLSSSDVGNLLTQPLTASVNTSQSTYFGLYAYKIIYWTTDKEGNKIRASGLLVIPDYSSLPPDKQLLFSYPLVTDNHGTIFLNDEAPTEDISTFFNGGSPTGSTLSLVLQYTGTLGFAVAMPDYIGYGESVDHYHPYMIAEPLANSVADMIKAVYEYAEKNTLPMKREVYLAGYSEGGFVTMASARKLQGKTPYHIKAVFPMAGVYNMEKMGLGIITAGSMVFPPYPAYVVYAYSKAYSDIVLQNILQSAFQSTLDTLFDKTKDGTTIYGMMFAYAGKDPNNDTFLVSDFFTLDAIDSFINNPDFPLRKRLRENNVDNWVPQMKMIFIHCGGDNILPQQLAYETYQKFASNGAPDVDFIDPEVVFGTGSLDHSNCASYAYQILFLKLCEMELAPKGVVCSSP